MQIQQALRELFWNSTAIGSLPVSVLSLAVAALLGAVLGQAYIRYGLSLSNRRVFARNFLLLTVTTTLIITIIKSSMALSLGLVGALSIVRFRAAIKEPEELAFLFLAIGVGVGLGAGQGLLTVVAFLAILGLIALRGLVRKAPDQPNLHLSVTSSAPGKLTAVQILETLGASGARASLKRYDETPDVLEASFLVDFKDAGMLQQFSTRLRELSPHVRISCLDDGGIGA